MKTSNNPMQRAHEAPRCNAKSKRTGKPCRAPAVKGWSVCRMHGAGGGHAEGVTHPAWQHGMRSHQWLEQNRKITELLKHVGETNKAFLLPKKR